MLTVGLTGGAGSGKTTVARFFEQQGARVVDADRVAHALLANDAEVHTGIVRLFGDGVLDARGAIDRAALARRIFADRDERRALEDLLHPRIRAEIEKERQRASSEGFDGVLVVEAALLVETGRANAYDLLLVVEAPPEKKIARQVAGRGSTLEDAQARLAAQAPVGAKMLAADLVIWNDGDPETLIERAREAWTFLEKTLRSS